jgi:hypothetical protein
MLEEMCDPDKAAGEWITNIDLQENGDKLQLVEMPQVQCEWQSKSLEPFQHSQPSHHECTILGTYTK